MNVIVNGANGHMGQAVIARLLQAGHAVIAKVDPQMEASLGYTCIQDVNEKADVLIDFSSPKALDGLIAYAQTKKCPIVLATTGYTAIEEEKIRNAAKTCAIFKSANMSLGINLLKRLIVQAAKILGEDFDVEIIETHHNQKKDAPSGTALLLYDALKDVYDAPRDMRPGRFGADALRDKREIGVHAVRGGTVPGIHEVCFYGHDETVSFTHSAQCREVFAIGAVKAAQYLLQINACENPGLYTMADLMG